jgi:hypothetical protein
MICLFDSLREAKSTMMLTNALLARNNLAAGYAEQIAPRDKIGEVVFARLVLEHYFESID